MKKTLTAALFASTAMAGTAMAQDVMTIGITQNNVGVDSYQTTYEKAFIEATGADDSVEAVVLDAGGDVARQIAQMEDPDPAGSRCHHHLADKWRSCDPCRSQSALALVSR